MIAYWQNIGFDTVETEPRQVCCMIRARESWFGIVSFPGFAGECASTKQVINIFDAYESPMFNQQIDQKLGFRTQSVLSVPVCDDADRINPRTIGVVQMINKMEYDGRIGTFGQEDIDVLETLAWLLI